MASKKTASKPAKYYVVVAEYDESGSDGLGIDNVVEFDTAEEAAKWVEEDYNDTMEPFVDLSGDEDVFLKSKDVLKAVKKLKPNQAHEWDTPEGETPVWVKWKVFYKG